jgi:hypothetical protein
VARWYGLEQVPATESQAQPCGEGNVIILRASVSRMWRFGLMFDSVELGAGGGLVG